MSDAQTAEIANTSAEPPPSDTALVALADLRRGMTNVPIDVMLEACKKYADWRTAFRRWLMSQLIVGVHYGFVPGCEPKFDDKGWIKIKTRDGYMNVSPESWQAKPSLYQSGADLICDLLSVRHEFIPDYDASKLLSNAEKTVFVVKCVLHSKMTGGVIGEGIGARRMGAKGGDENNGVKMAAKCAKVAAVLNAFGLSDLFTQDIEHAKPEHDNPAPATGPTVPTRQQRESGWAMTKEMIGGMVTAFLTLPGAPERSNRAEVKIKFNAYVGGVTKSPLDFYRTDAWTPDFYRAVAKALGIPE